MKLVANILIGSLLLLGVNRFVEHMEHAELQTELSCEIDCCASHNDCEDQEESSDRDHACPPGCNCDCCFPIAAIEYQFLNNSIVAPQACYPGAYSNRYHFIFTTPIFEPPRLG